MMPSSPRAVLPAKPPIAFPEPVILPARRLTGVAVHLPTTAASSHDASCTKPDVKMMMPQSLERRESVASNILCVNEQHYFWMQRKLRTTQHGSVRVGFVLKDPASTSLEGGQSASAAAIWEVVSKKGEGDDDAQVQMVAIRIENKNVSHVINEVAALQWVAKKHDPDTSSVVGDGMLAAADSNSIFTVSPYHCTQQTLFEYCTSQPGKVVSEAQALFFFREIVKGLRTLQRAQICHCNLSLESVLLQRRQRDDNDKKASDDSSSSSSSYSCTITNLEHALRIPMAEDGVNYHLLEHRLQTLLASSNSSPQYLAPELWNIDETTAAPPFDGYAVDLWSAGVMVLAMLFGTDALFVAPVPEDRTFLHICVQGQLKHHVRKRKLPVSDDALDLLQRMLRVDPNDRLTLAQVEEHSWVKGK